MTAMTYNSDLDAYIYRDGDQILAIDPAAITESAHGYFRDTYARAWDDGTAHQHDEAYTYAIDDEGWWQATDATPLVEVDGRLVVVDLGVAS